MTILLGLINRNPFLEEAASIRKSAEVLDTDSDT